MSPSRIGVLGGTFDPPHYGHLAIAEEARVRLNLERVLFVPAREPPHKPGRPISPVEDRLAMVQAAIADNPAFTLSRVDVDRPGPSYTVDTMALLQAQLGSDAQLYLIIGMDSLRDLPTWHQPARLLDLCHIVAVSRPGYSCDMAALARLLPAVTTRVILIDGPALDISATELQRRIRAGLPIRYQVPEPVRRYIYEKGLYGYAGPRLTFNV